MVGWVIDPLDHSFLVAYIDYNWRIALSTLVLINTPPYSTVQKNQKRKREKWPILILKPTFTSQEQSPDHVYIVYNQPVSLLSA